MRRAFTLIELLVIIALVGVMTTVSVLSVRAGQGAARVRGAARDILAQMRHARSVALVSRSPSYITYATKVIDDEVCAVVEVKCTSIFGESRPGTAVTLSGETVDLNEGGFEEGVSPLAQLVQQGLEPEIAKGIRVKVLREDEELESARSQEQQRSSISASAFVDGQKMLDLRAEQFAKDATEPLSSENQEPVTFMWEANGRTEPHRVYVYADGASPDEALVVDVDRFGAIKVLAAGEEEN